MSGAVAGWITLLLAFWITPWLAAGMLVRSRRLIDRAAAAAVCGAGLNTLLPVVLHALPVPLSGLTLTVAHGALAAVAVGLWWWQRGRVVTVPLTGPPDWLVPVTGLALLLLLFPYTHFTGVDTYKWQDLAVAAYAAESIPWLVHPLSLLGFTPRAYPAAQPLMLASIYLLTGLHVRVAFYCLSLWTAAAALSTTLALGRRAFRCADTAHLFAACYVLAPVFVRYSHWATGRGLFLALFPAYLLVLLALPRRRACAWLVPVAGVLLLTHKVAWVAIPLGLVSCVAGWVGWNVIRLSGSVKGIRARVAGTCAHAYSAALASSCNRWGRAVAVMAAVLLAALIVPRWGGGGAVGMAGGLVRYGLARGNWLAPVALAALVSGATGLTVVARARFLVLGLCSVPLFFEAQMYGALVALPAVAALAAGGAGAVLARVPQHGCRIRVCLWVLLLAGAVLIVGQRNRLAASPRLVQAARFLQSHDPEGPFMIVAPGRARPLMQAYQTGSPRFDVTAETDARIRWHHPPVRRAGVAETVRAWSIWGRGMLDVEGVETDWYGPDHTRYYVTIDGAGEVPAAAVRLYTREGIEIYQGP